tara:strand:- start:437 stop:721 length:285 start_codon:yes stop_codon:yes gene_type:complete
MTITTQEAVSKIHGLKGGVFGAEHIKRTNGEIRIGAYRMGVQKGVTGEGLKFDPAKKNLLGVFDMNSDGFRFLDLNNLLSVTVNGQKFTVAGQQ